VQYRQLRLTPPHGRRLGQATSFEASFGGAEANVAVSLANLGHASWFASRVPENDIGQTAVDELRRYGVRDDWILRGGPRLGVFYLECGAGHRPSSVIYDRAHSSFSDLSPGEFDWERILSGASWFHVSGITPGLGEGPRSALAAALSVARSKNVVTSIDVNYRSQLWGPERAGEVLSTIIPAVKVLIVNIEHARILFGIGAREKITADACRECADALRARFGCPTIAVTVRRSPSAFDTTWWACVSGSAGFHVTRSYDIHLVDRVGSGDAFAAGLIHGILTGMGDAAAAEFGSAAACLCHSMPGDFNLASAEEIQRLASGGEGDHLRR
jgi:2-dehydro-3-deoxygluconokinase